jgi:nucleotide-binding universal stress UspA family protein
MRLGLPVTLLHVIERNAPAVVHKERHLTDPQEARNYLEEVSGRAFPKEAKVAWHVHDATIEDVPRSIVEHASEFQPALIVMCSHGYGGVRDLLYGNIAQQIIALGSAPLMLVKPDSAPFKLERMLVPLDPDSLHDVSLPTAQELAGLFEAELCLISVVPSIGTWAGEQAAAGTLLPATTAALLDLKEQNANADLQGHLKSLHSAGLRATAQVSRGDPPAMILQAAEQTQADLIVLSTHRRAGAAAFWARSVAPKVVNRSAIPILLIPLN